MQTVMNKIEQAIKWAISAHTDQVRKGSINGLKLPFIVHPLAVMRKVWYYGATETRLIASILHDVLEDTDRTWLSVVEYFGCQVADIVQELTYDPKKCSKETYMASFASKSLDALVIKYCDRACNIDDFDSVPETRDYAKKYCAKAKALFKTILERRTEIMNGCTNGNQLIMDVMHLSRTYDPPESVQPFVFHQDLV